MTPTLTLPHLDWMSALSLCASSPQHLRPSRCIALPTGIRSWHVKCSRPSPSPYCVLIANSMPYIADHWSLAVYAYRAIRRVENRQTVQSPVGYYLLLPREHSRYTWGNIPLSSLLVTTKPANPFLPYPSPPRPPLRPFGGANDLVACLF